MPETPEEEVVREPTTGEIVGEWALNLLRSMVTLILIGLLLAWLFPMFVRALSSKLTAQPLPSLGWGALAWAAFVFSLLVIVAVMILGGVFFGFLTLGNLGGAIVWLGLLSLFAVCVGFVLVTSYLTKVVVGESLGRWILGRTSPALADHRYWPMVLGVAVVVLVVGVLNFPFVPLLGFLGFWVNLAVVLFGLGALWLATRDAWAARKAA
jgi:hypothetical protein